MSTASIMSRPFLFDDDDNLFQSLDSSLDLSFLSGTVDDFFFHQSSNNSINNNNSTKAWFGDSLVDFSSVQSTKEKLTEMRVSGSSTKYPNRSSITSQSNVVPIATTSSSSSSTLTPLKELDFKRNQNNQQQPKTTKKQSKTATTTTTTTTKRSHELITRIVSKSSDSMVLDKSKSDDSSVSSSYSNGRPIKKLKASSSSKDGSSQLSAASSPSLHEACRRGPDLTVLELENILKKDPEAASRPLRLMTTKKVYNAVSCTLDDKVVPEQYQYPLNIAISYNASSAVIECLIKAYPQVLNMSDNHESRSLHILLRHRPTDVVSTDIMLLQEPEIVTQTDQKQNNALHAAISNGACLEIIRHLAILQPELLTQRNFHGQTPLDISRHLSYLCSDDVSNYLLQLQQSEAKDVEKFIEI